MIFFFSRYGRTTVATLETKLASAEKDITRLTKAMERSDKYIEELESELDGYRGTNSGAKRDKYLVNGNADNRKVMSDSKVSQYSDYKAGKDTASRRQLFSEDKESRSSTAGERSSSKYYYDRNGDDRGSLDPRDGYSDYSNDMSVAKTSQSVKNGMATNGKKRVTFDLEKNTNSTTSFDLELPSPLKSSGNRNGLSNGRASPVKGVLKKPGGKGGIDDKSMDSYTDLSRTADDSDIYTSKSSSRQSKDDHMLYSKSRSRSEERDYKSDNLYSKPKKKYSADDSFLSEPSSMEVKSLSEFDYCSKRAGDRKTDIYDRQRGDHDSKRRDISNKSYDSDLTRDDLEDTQCIESELDELNISVTPEFTDCMKLLNRAEKKVHTHDTSDEEDGVQSRYRSSQDTATDKAFRASTGSIGGYKSTGISDDLRASTGSYGYKASTGEDFLSTYKSDTGSSSRFTSSRGGHVRSGSLDNIYIASCTGGEERPSSALPTSANMYTASSTQNRYSTGLTTGRTTTLTRTPSLDNLLMSRPSTVEYLHGQNLNRYSVGRSYRGETEGTKVDVNSNINPGVGSTGNSWQKPVTAVHGILGDVDTGVDRTQDNRAVTFDSVLQARARSLSDIGSGKSELDRMAPSSGRVTPTLSGSTGGRVTPTIPTHSEYMASSIPAYPTTASGRSTPTLASNTTNFDTLTKPKLQYSDYKTSSTVDMAHKPPTGLKHSDFNPSLPSYLTSSSHTAPNQYSSLPVYSSTIGAGQFDNKVDSGPMSAQYSGSRYSDLTSKNEFNYDNFNIGARPSSITSSTSQPTYSSSDDKYSSHSSYNNHNFMDSDYTPYSSTSTGVPATSGSNSSALFTGSVTSSSSLYGSYAGSSYLPSSVPSYTSATLSVPITHTTTSYTSSNPSYPSTKPLDPIAESSNHFSYVSNASGDFSSKNDTFGLPEPKKRLFEDSEDLNLSVSPIKSNRRF